MKRQRMRNSLKTLQNKENRQKRQKSGKPRLVYLKNLSKMEKNLRKSLFKNLKIDPQVFKQKPGNSTFKKSTSNATQPKSGDQTPYTEFQSFDRRKELARSGSLYRSSSKTGLMKSSSSVFAKSKKLRTLASTKDCQTMLTKTQGRTPFSKEQNLFPNAQSLMSTKKRSNKFRRKGKAMRKSITESFHNASSHKTMPSLRKNPRPRHLRLTSPSHLTHPANFLKFNKSFGAHNGSMPKSRKDAFLSRQFSTMDENITKEMKIPDFHTYFKTNTVVPRSNTIGFLSRKHKSNTVDLKDRRQAKTGLARLLKMNTMVSNEKVKDIIGDSIYNSKIFKTFQGLSPSRTKGLQAKNYSWRNKLENQEDRVIQSLKKQLKKNNGIKSHIYVSEDDRCRMEKFLMLNERFLYNKSNTKEKPFQNTWSKKILRDRKNLRLNFYKNSK